MKILTGSLTNSTDPDEMPHSATFHMGLHCLPKCLFAGFDFVRVDALRPSQQIISYARRLSCLPGLNQY